MDSHGKLIAALLRPFEVQVPMVLPRSFTVTPIRMVFVETIQCQCIAGVV